MAKVNKVKINFNIDESIHYQVKRLALDKKTTATALYTEWIKKGLEDETGQQKLDVE